MSTTTADTTDASADNAGSVIAIFQNPSTTGPNLRFNNGEVVNGVEQYQDTLPSLPGDFNADWDITQWCAGTYFDPTSPLLADAAFRDDVLGTPIASWEQGSATSSTGYSSLSIYDSSQADDSSDEGKKLTGYTYRIQVQGGTLNDVNLQSYKQMGNNYTFNNQITFTANERITDVSGSTGLASFGNNFTVNFNTAKQIAGVPQLGIFLQCVAYDSRGVATVQAGYSTLTHNDGGAKIYNPGDLTVTDFTLGNLYYNYSSTVDAFAGATDDFSKVTINLNAAVEKIISILSASDPANAAYYQDMSNWVLTGSYIGGEAGNLGSTSTSNASAALEVNDVNITEDTASNVTYSAADQKIVSISGIQTEDYWTTTTTPSDGTTNLLLDAGTSSKALGTGKSQTVTTNGTDTLTVGDKTVATIHAQGASTTIVGQGGSATVDGSGAVTVSGTFSSFSSTNTNASSTYSATVTGGSTVSVAAGTVSLAMSASGTLNLTSGSSANYVIDTQSGVNSTIMTGNDSATVSNSGKGTQVIVSGNVDSTGTLTVNGGGAQQVWTGSEDTVINASDAAGITESVFATSHANSENIYVGVQGGQTTVNLNTEFTNVWSYGGHTTINGSTSSLANDLMVSDGGDMDISGGAGTINFVGFQVNDDPKNVASVTITAGSGSETIFGDGVNLTVNGGDSATGSQMIISSSAASKYAAETINGGAGYQEIWSSTRDAVVNASTTTATGSIRDIVEGGTTTFNAGIEDATIFSFGGNLVANLAGAPGTQDSSTTTNAATGHVAIQGDVTKFSSIVLNDFSSEHDSLILTGLTGSNGYTMTQSNGSTVLTFDSSSAQVTLVGVTEVTVGHIGDTALQLYANTSN